MLASRKKATEEECSHFDRYIWGFGSAGVGNLTGRVGSGQVGSGRVRSAGVEKKLSRGSCWVGLGIS